MQPVPFCRAVASALAAPHRVAGRPCFAGCGPARGRVGPREAEHRVGPHRGGGAEAAHPDGREALQAHRDARDAERQRAQPRKGPGPRALPRPGRARWPRRILQKTLQRDVLPLPSRQLRLWR